MFEARRTLPSRGSYPQPATGDLPYSSAYLSESGYTQTPLQQAVRFPFHAPGNDLVSHHYETLPINNSRLPGYTGHVPGGGTVVGQRTAQATLHTHRLQPELLATKGGYQDMQLVDLRPTERSYNKNYCYAENNTTSNFMKFPTKATFDHRKL
eukprot:gene2201-33759_t